MSKKSFSLPSVMSHDFSRAPKADIDRSSIDRSSGYKSAIDGGYLYPFFTDEVLPGDTFNVKATIIARLATPIFPVMDNIYLDTHWFFCPNRLLWSNFKRFCGEQDDPDDSTDYIMPVITTPSGGYDEDSLADFFGLPPSVEFDPVRSEPFNMYNLTWNQWFRDENLQDSVPVDLTDGPHDPTNYNLLKRGKRHDYFTSCLPWAQKGDEVTLPLGTAADVKFGTNINGVSRQGDWVVLGEQGNADAAIGYGETAGTVTSLTSDSKYNIYADLSTAIAPSINTFIQAFAYQDLLVRDARGGTRYTELIQAHFGVSSPDSRLQRVEFLGSSSKPISFYTVAQTGETSNTPQGNLSAYALGEINNEGFVKSFTEHGWIMGLVSLRADLNYQQGVERKWSRSTRYDFYWPSLANLGEQAVLNKEIYAQGTSADDDVFGYQERWAEYRYKPSLITGAMRSSATAPLDAWHLAQDFSELPTLGATFIEENPPIDRVIAVPSEPAIIFDSYIKAICARPMPLYSVPSLSNHF